jgi:thiamine biosynthesis protein ThiS
VTVRVLVNGKPREAPEAATVASLLEKLEIPAARVAVEHNRKVLKRAEFSGTLLREGDRLEIVHFVGGG